MWGMGHSCADNDPKICMDCYNREAKGYHEAIKMLRDILNDGATWNDSATGEQQEFHADFDKAKTMVESYFANVRAVGRRGATYPPARGSPPVCLHLRVAFSKDFRTNDSASRRRSMLLTASSTSPTPQCPILETSRAKDTEGLSSFGSVFTQTRMPPC